MRRRFKRYMAEKETPKSVLRSPAGVAVIGGVLALLTALVGNLIQGIVSINLQRQKQESELILKAHSSFSPQ